MPSVKAFGILIGAQGGGVQIAGIAEIARHRRDRVNPKPLTTKNTKGCGGDPRTLRRIKAKSLKSTPIWDAVG
jgi:hypothetical protein